MKVSTSRMVDGDNTYTVKAWHARLQENLRNSQLLAQEFRDFVDDSSIALL